MRTRPAERFELYEIAVTNASMLARFARAVAPRSARVLREDFSGTGALARAWANLSPDHRALAVDIDAGVLRLAPPHVRVTPRVRDVMRARDRADVIAATNFALGYLHTRRALVAYLTHARRCLARGGTLVADMYGGASAFEVGTTRRRVRRPDSGWFWYEWEQREADALSGRVRNAIHFRIPPPRNATRERASSLRNATRERAPAPRQGPAPRLRVIRDAFSYDWRLWSIPELREASLDAGFARVDVYARLGEAIDHEGNLYPRAMEAGEALDDDWVVYIVAHARGAPRRR